MRGAREDGHAGPGFGDEDLGDGSAGSRDAGHEFPGSLSFSEDECTECPKSSAQVSVARRAIQGRRLGFTLCGHAASPARLMAR